MKYYNFKLAVKIIETLSNLDTIISAELGMKEDWFWTAETVWSKKEGFERELNEETKIGGINSSYWATPVMIVTYKDGTQKMFKCYTSDSEENDILETIKQSLFWTSGALAKPAQEYIDELEIETFEV